MALTLAEEVLDALRDVAFVCNCGWECLLSDRPSLNTVDCPQCARGWRRVCRGGNVWNGLQWVFGLERGLWYLAHKR